MKLERVVVQAFRGFPARIEISLAGDVTLIYGENGTGKTSLTEALEWALFGTIVRKARSKSPSEYRGWDWLRSAHAASDDATFVEVVLRRPDGTLVVVRRELVGSTTQLLLDGKPGSTIADVGLRGEDVFRPFLGQSEIQAVIDSEQQDRWQQLSAILGFGDFGALRSRLQRLRTDADHNPSVAAVRETATRVVQPLTPPTGDPLEVAPDELRLRAAKFLAIREGSRWPEILQAASGSLDSLYRRNLRPAGLDALVSRAMDTATVGAFMEAMRLVLAEADAHRRWHKENEFAAFAGQGLRLVDPNGDQCPFCGEETLTPERLSALQAAAASAPARPHDHRVEMRELLTTITSAPGPIDRSIGARLLEGLGEGDHKARLARLIEGQSEIVDLSRQAVGLTEGLLAATTKAQLPDGDVAAIGALAEQVSAAIERLTARRAAVRTEADLLVADMTAALTTLTDDEKKQLARLQAAQTLAENASSVEAAWRVRTLQKALEGAVRLLEEAEKRLMKSALRTLSGDIARYYETLSPGHHIRISGVSVRDTRHRQASLNATSFGRPVNPVTTFSEAEGNCLGLSLYFSQRVDRNPDWQTILLDDPVQSMDEGHEQSLVHLLSSVGRDRQVIVLTHNKRFAEAIDAQFAALPAFGRYNFESSGSPQPRIEVAAGRLDELLDFAEENAGGDRIVRESCATAIRKSVERFARDLAAAKRTTVARRLSPEGLVDRVHAAGLVDNIDVGTLHRLRRFGSRGAHEDSDVNASETAIRTNVKAMRDLQTRHLVQQPTLKFLRGTSAG